MRPAEGSVYRWAGTLAVVFGWWKNRRKGARAARQQGDVLPLDRGGDPRGGVQSEQYRTADPRELVEDDGVVMAGPGGAPQEDESTAERRDRNRENP
jgi:hypothetical protein